MRFKAAKCPTTHIITNPGQAASFAAGATLMVSFRRRSSPLGASGRSAVGARPGPWGREAMDHRGGAVREELVVRCVVEEISASGGDDRARRGPVRALLA